MIKSVLAFWHFRVPWVHLLLVTCWLVTYGSAPLLAQTMTPPATEPAPRSTPTPPQAQRMVVARISFRDQSDLNTLAARYDLWQVHHGATRQERYVVAYLSDAELIALRARGYQVTVDSAATMQLLQPRVVAGAQQAGIPGYACYRTVEETYSSLAALATAHPDLATWRDIGDTWEKVTPSNAPGYDIYAFVLTNRARPGPKPKFLLMGAIHAREYTTAELATRFAEELVAKYKRDPDVTWLLDYHEIHIIPQANPDGRKLAEAGQLWRKNTNNTNGCDFSFSWGTDLNRNSSFQWNTGGSSSNACDLTYHGPSAASEPETQAIETYAQSIFPDQRGPDDSDPAPADASGVFISLHSYSELVLFPWGYTAAPSPNRSALQTLGRKFGYYNGYQVCTGPDCLYGTSGTTDDFTYGTLGVASYTFELGQNFFEGCNFFEENVLPKNMPALYYAAKVARRPYQLPSGPDVLQPTATFTGTTLLVQATIDDTRYNSNGWGIEASQPISAARLTIDTPAWITGTQVYTMSAGDGLFNATTEKVALVIDASAWPLGQRLLFIEGQDSAGNWGPPTALFVTTPGTPTPTPTPIPTAPPPTPTTPAPYHFYFPIIIP
ncbi:MAG: peptidase M14 [Caldilinea sp. CFX5]|nr:peptidase M14 [Caldilinea sp. CFX5]